jgi:hypothetical protein
MSFGNWVFAILIGFIFARIPYSLFLDCRRDQQLMKMAARLRLKMIGETLPGYVNLDGSPMAHATKYWNVMDGNFNGIRVLTFDCRMGQGKGSWRRTVLAAESDRDVFATVPSPFDYTVDRCGRWVVFYRPKGFSGPFLSHDLMESSELESRLLSIG